MKVLIIAICLTLLSIKGYADTETYYRTLRGWRSNKGNTMTQELNNQWTYTSNSEPPKREYTPPFNPLMESRQNRLAGRKVNFIDWTR